MPLSPAKPRSELHDRTYVMRGYEREDGLFDIEGSITDIKPYSFPNQDRGTIQAGEPLHEMYVRMTIDTEMLIHEMEVVTDNGPYNICPSIVGNYKNLVGTRIQPGWNAAVRKRVGGIHGCTHISDLLRNMATVAFQTMWPVMLRKQQNEGTPDPVNVDTNASASDKVKDVSIDKPKKMPLLNTCHAYAANGELVKERWPESYKGDKD